MHRRCKLSTGDVAMVAVVADVFTALVDDEIEENVEVEEVVRRT